jgi:hypothetical protein
MRRFASISILVALATVSVAGWCDGAPIKSGRTIIYFVRHGESDMSDPKQPLNESGKARARVFAATVQTVFFSHVFSTHTTRARQTVEPAAVAHGLEVTPLPQPGSVLDGVPVTDSTPPKAAVRPLVEALRQLPAGSSALVGVNGDNVYAILNGLGVPVATSGQRCSLGSTCLPCLDRTCFPINEYDNFWILIIDSVSEKPQLLHMRFGIPSEASRK